MSFIIALHDRIQAVWDESDIIDDAGRLSEGGQRPLLADALMSKHRECDALQAALLHQRPTDNVEAAILAQHLWSQVDAINSGSTPPKFLKRSMAHGFTALFAFLAESVPADLLGERFQADASLATERTNHRLPRPGSVA